MTVIIKFINCIFGMAKYIQNNNTNSEGTNCEIWNINIDINYIFIWFENLFESTIINHEIKDQ